MKVKIQIDMLAYDEVLMHIKDEEKNYCIGLVRFLLILNFEIFELQKIFPTRSSIRISAHYDNVAQDIWTQPNRWKQFLHLMCQRLGLSTDIFISQGILSTEPSLILLMEEWNQAVKSNDLQDKSVLLLRLLDRRGRCPSRIYARLCADCEVLAVRILRQTLIA